MRIIRNPFTLKDIAKLSEGEIVNLKHYFCTLKKAGYIVVVGYKSMSPKPGQECFFRLAKNTGPRPPIMKDLRHLYDPNTKEYWVAKLHAHCIATLANIGEAADRHPILTHHRHPV